MRYFLISIGIHVLVLSFVWIGFSVPVGRGQNSFTYLGEMMDAPEGYQSPSVSNEKDSTEAVVVGSSSDLFNPWLKMRQVDKPR